MASLVSQVFVDTSALAGWESDLFKLNQDAVKAIRRFVSSSDLTGAFESEKIDGLTDSIQDSMNQAIIKHENLEDFSGPFLTEVIYLTENE